MASEAGHAVLRTSRCGASVAHVPREGDKEPRPVRRNCTTKSTIATTTKYQRRLSIALCLSLPSKPAPASTPPMSSAAETSHGRGGAGNIIADDTEYMDGEVVRQGQAGSHGDGAFSAGRGGECPFHASSLSHSPRCFVHDPGASSMPPGRGSSRASVDENNRGELVVLTFLRRRQHCRRGHGALAAQRPGTRARRRHPRELGASGLSHGPRRRRQRAHVPGPRPADGAQDRGRQRRRVAQPGGPAQAQAVWRLQEVKGVDGRGPQGSDVTDDV